MSIFDVIHQLERLLKSTLYPLHPWYLLWHTSAPMPQIKLSYWINILKIICLFYRSSYVKALAIWRTLHFIPIAEGELWHAGQILLILELSVHTWKWYAPERRLGMTFVHLAIFKDAIDSLQLFPIFVGLLIELIFCQDFILSIINHALCSHEIR